LTLNQIGYFRELEHGDPLGLALADGLSASPHPREGDIVRYLRQGHAMATSPILVEDALDPERPPIGTLQILTDGKWEWPSDLAYYVDRYHVRLPDDFVEHMASQEWQPPPLSEAELMNLVREQCG
jgi:hypothetical protein